MRKAIFFGVIFTFLCGVAAGQKKEGVPAVGPTVDAGTKIEGELQTSLDAQNAKVGDQVVLKTTKAVKQNGHTVIAKGSTLIGRVTEVQKRTKENNRSRLGVLFERVKGGSLDSPINASITAITSVAASARSAGASDTDLFGSSPTSAGTSGRSSGGRLLGGTGGLVAGATSTVGGVLNTATQAAAPIAGTASQTFGTGAGAIINTANGIQITNSGSASAEAGSISTLSAVGRNVRLEKGASVQLQLNSSIGRHEK